MIIKFNENGKVLWVKQFGDTTLSNATGDQNTGFLLSDDDGNLYISGYTKGRFAENNASPGEADIIFFKIDSDGNLKWKTQFGADTRFVNGGNTGWQIVMGMQFDSQGQIIYVGYTNGGPFTEPHGGGNFDLIMGAINPNDGSANWAKHYGANTPLGSYNNSQYFIPSGLQIDDQDNMYMGYYTHGGSVGEAAGGSTDIGFLKMDKNQNLVWIKQYGATTTLVDGGLNTSAEFGGYFPYGQKWKSVLSRVYNRITCLYKRWSI